MNLAPKSMYKLAIIPSNILLINICLYFRKFIKELTFFIYFTSHVILEPDQHYVVFKSVRACLLKGIFGEEIPYLAYGK